MPEADMTLRQKTSELQTALDEVRGELSRVDQAHRTEAHRELVAICKDAAAWLEKHAQASQSASTDDAASLTQQAESLLRDLRMRRNAI